MSLIEATDSEAVNLLALGVLSDLPPLLMVPDRTLSTDAGGIRGISQLVILDEIMKRIQTDLGLAELPRPCDYFHLIGGAGTGG
jgi:hypothetical protein